MADGLNDTRVVRMLELLGDFRALQANIQAQVTRPNAKAPNAAAASLDGYRILRAMESEARRILSTNQAPPSNLRPGQTPNTEDTKRELQRIILDSATRRFLAHRIYLRVAAAIRWIMTREQVMRQPANVQASQMQNVDRVLRQELAAITDVYVFNNLRQSDVQHGYWINEDPTIDQINQWAQGRY